MKLGHALRRLDYAHPYRIPIQAYIKFRTVLQTKELLLNDKQKAWLEALSVLRKPSGVIALETGRIRDPAARRTDGNSTYFLSKLPQVEQLFSLDDDSENRTGRPTSQAYCRDYLSTAQLKKVVFWDGHSVELLKSADRQLRIDFVLLDSANDADLIFNEFQAVAPLLNREQAVVFVDDISLEGHKGDRLIPYLTSLGLTEHRRTSPPSDCSYFVLSDWQLPTPSSDGLA